MFSSVIDALEHMRKHNGKTRADDPLHHSMPAEAKEIVNKPVCAQPLL